MGQGAGPTAGPPRPRAPLEEEPKGTGGTTGGREAGEGRRRRTRLEAERGMVGTMGHGAGQHIRRPRTERPARACMVMAAVAEGLAQAQARVGGATVGGFRNPRRLVTGVAAGAATDQEEPSAAEPQQRIRRVAPSRGRTLGKARAV
jgi:hypothetical protein